MPTCEGHAFLSLTATSGHLGEETDVFFLYIGRFGSIRRAGQLAESAAAIAGSDVASEIAIEPSQLGGRRVLKDNCLFSSMNGDSRMGVIARAFRIRDLAKKFFTFNDVKTYTLTVRRENNQYHVVLGNNHSQRTRLIMGHLDETAGLVCDFAQLLEINHTHTPRN
jgi:hypothetical protein